MGKDLIKILQPVADWPAGAVIAVEPKRAERLVRTGYAERHVDPPPAKARKDKE